MKLFEVLLFLHLFFIVGYSTGSSSPSHLRYDDLDVDALFATPIEPIFKDSFHSPSSSANSYSDVTSKPKGSSNIYSNVNTQTDKRKFDHIDDRQLRRKQIKKESWQREAGKDKQMYGETHKWRGIRKQLNQLSKDGKINKQQEEHLQQLNERHQSDLAKKRIRDARKRQEKINKP